MSTTKIYHERQIRQLCALHTLNNLFQAKNTYTKEDLDEICNNLTPNVWINPHCSMLGLGNYDINVIMTALQMKNCEAVWFDKRKDPACINLNVLIGLILNVPTDYKLGFVSLPFRRRHWIAIKRIGDAFYNLDSKLNTPERIGNGDENDLLTYLRKELETNERELFLVLKQNKEDKDSNTRPCWLKEDYVLNDGAVQETT